MEIIAKRSVVSAANYAERSSFAKDQILFLSFYRSEFACKRGSHTTYFVSSLCQHIAALVAMVNVVLIHGFYFFIFLFIEYLYRVFTLQKIYTKIKFLLSTCALVIIKDKILKALKEK